ncbi:hypothetical protein [Mesorhizobium jarvisii]|uniref:hypothetical protein n=1 Tax=Mesorhizobium jarvisii TaxID=1777867 RepID=UPI001F0B6AFA|nr:hypothetical protein [Mesorhizobium jarvisii]MCH4561363.1 hypothetical protein [Mesorhizobium jarvisii]
MFGFGARSVAKTLTPTQVRQMGDAVALVDVREDGEWASGHMSMSYGGKWVMTV